MTTKTKRKFYSKEFKEEALKVASKVGFSQAARELSVAESQLYYWRTATLKKASTSDRESTLAIENARLKRQLGVQAEELDILKKAATYFAKNQKYQDLNLSKATEAHSVLSEWLRHFVYHKVGIMHG